MSDLYLNQDKIETVFQLLGNNENDMTYTLAWVLSNSDTYLKNLLKNFLGSNIKVNLDEVSIYIQKYEKERGITDIEIVSPDFHIIIEAKKGWNLPTKSQLETYANRSDFHKAPIKKLIVLSECSHEFAKNNLPIHKFNNTTIETFSWKEVLKVAESSKAGSSNSDKRLLSELIKYLGRLVSVRKIDSNLAFVVVLGSGKPDGWKISWKDIVNKKSYYFHPVGIKGWPKDPPNYIAFRYNGKLQSIHHIEEYEVVTNINKHIPEIPITSWEPHFLYTLGPKITPSKEVKNGKLYPNGRYWCMFDTLLTSDTIAEARDITKERLNE